MFRFGSSACLFGLLAIPALALFFLVTNRVRRRTLERFGELRQVDRLAPALDPGRRRLKQAFLLAALACFVLALARPRVGTRLEEVKRRGLDVFVAVDVSLSMDAGDFPPSRLARAKREVAGFINRLEGDRIGLIVFAGEAFVQCPLTLDYPAARLFLDVIDSGIIPVQGTAIGEAIRKATASFVQDESRHKVLILITDGEDTVSDPMPAAVEAEEAGVVIHSVGIGSSRGVPIPVYDAAGRRTGFKKDDQGNVVTSRLDPLLLEKISLQTGGRFYPATGSGRELEKILRSLRGMEEKDLSSLVFSRYEDRFQILLGTGLLFLLAAWVSPDRKRVKMAWKGRFT